MQLGGKREKNPAVRIEYVGSTMGRKINYFCSPTMRLVFPQIGEDSEDAFESQEANDTRQGHQAVTQALEVILVIMSSFTSLFRPVCFP